jgi:hypothetical protein
MKTTNEHFRLFQAECEKWIEFFGLYGWSVHYKHVKIDGCYGQCLYNTVGRVATIELNTYFEFAGKPVVTIVKETAFHEICELLLGKLRDLSIGKMSSNYDVVDEEIHNIIRILENKVFE